MKLSILILLCSIIISCTPKCEKVYFTANDRNWFENYEINDKLIFKSNQNDFDTILITNKELIKPDGECILFASDGYDREYARVEYEIQKDTFKLVQDYFVQIRANEENKDANPVLRLLNIEFSISNLPKSKPSDLNSDWKNVYRFNENNCPYTNLNGMFGLTEFEWDKNFGLVTYKNNEGEKWILIKKE